MPDAKRRRRNGSPCGMPDYELNHNKTPSGTAQKRGLPAWCRAHWPSAKLPGGGALPLPGT
eukprot:3154190-Prorocentrum_lima.AAC.1